jgi:type I restriction enzyme M protein
MTADSRQQQTDLHKKLWDMANSLRGQMEASEFKNYILSVIFYRFLSEKVETKVEELLSNDAGETYVTVWNDEDVRYELESELVDSLGYSVKPEHLFSTFITDIDRSKFSIITLQEAVNSLNSSTVGGDMQESFDHLFDDLDLTSSKLGKDASARTSVISRIIEHVNEIPFKHDDVQIDVLGDAYEYLISKFAKRRAGNRLGVLPAAGVEYSLKSLQVTKQHLKNVYDPTCGSGSLLLRVAREMELQGKDKPAVDTMDRNLLPRHTTSPA